MRGGRKGRFNVNQLQINWNGVKVSSPVDSAEKRPVLRLRWDYKNNFPQPLPEAVDAGQLTEEDTLPDSVQAIHQEHGRRMLDALSDLDAASDRNPDDPQVSASSVSDELTEPTRLQRWYASLLGVYEEWFGTIAAEAFDRAVRAWHAHVEVVVDRRPPAAAVAPPPQQMAAAPPIIDIEVCEQEVAATTVTASESPKFTVRRTAARLPVPRPLPATVEAGQFGKDDQGQPIDPSADEVWDITVNHAEELIDLLSEQQEAERRGLETHVARLSENIQAACLKYAEDFGTHAAEQLLAYARRQMLVLSREGKSSPHVGR